jgi:hypothetical protein
MIPQKDKCGYLNLRISTNNIKENLRIHRVVAESFICNSENKPQVNHKDGEKSNNNMSNLEWSTNSENQKHAVDLGLRVHHSGERASRFESKISVYKDSKHLYDLAGNKELALYGYDYRLVSAVILGKRAKHKGCTFKRIKENNT